MTETLTLQHVIYPEAEICTEIDLYVHLSGPAGFGSAQNTIHLETGGSAKYDTYFNMLSIGKWAPTRPFDGLWLALEAEGRFELRVYHAIPDRSWELLVCEVMDATGETRVDVSDYAAASLQGTLFFEILALGPAVVIRRAAWEAEATVADWPRLALSITTFKREAAVARTAERLDAWLKSSPFAAHLHVFIVDNGASAEILASPRITKIENANLGGAGGFTRGLLEAEAAGFTHVLFMDDDASFHMENIHRTYAFLALSADPNTAVAGAMINTSEKWKMWENGATFDRKCRPIASGTDLRDAGKVARMEFKSARPPDLKLYGGWWHFAFPIAAVARHPFPFFVRGDDVNFSLVNDFTIRTLNGVVCFQDDFNDKSSPLTWYLDFRSHLVHHLTLPKMEVGAGPLAWMGIWFALRNLLRFQYETIDAVCLAWEDVMEGPDFFVKNADMATRRATLKALTHQEAWRPVAELDLSERMRFDGSGLIVRRIFQLLLNGHLLPFYRLIGNRAVVPPGERGGYEYVYGSYRITYLNATREMGYTTQQSKVAAAQRMLRVFGLALRFLFAYPRLRAAYRRRYPEITNRTFWTERLEITPGDVELGAAAQAAAE